MSAEAVVACPGCDVLHRLPALPARRVARCRRCGTLLSSGLRDGIEAVLALSVTALLMFVIANSFPFMSVELSGQRVQISLVSSVQQLWQQGHVALATLVLFTTIIAPGLQVGLMLYVTAPLFAGRLPWGAQAAFRTVDWLRPWGMAEVFLLAVIISVVKLDDLGEVIPGIALWGLAVLVLLLAASYAVLDPRQLWARLEAVR